MLADVEAGHTAARCVRRALTASFSVSLAIQAANAVTGILLARALGPHDRGALAAVILWPSLLATLGSVGLPEAVTYYAARRTISLGTLLGTSLVIAASASTIVVLAGIFIIPIVLAGLEPDTVRLALIFLAFIPLQMFSLSLMGVLNGQGRFSAFHALRAMVIFLAAVTIAALAAAGALRPETAAAAYLGASSATLIAAAMLLATDRRGSLSVSRHAAKDLISYGIKSQTSTVSSTLNERLDQLVISAVLAPAKLGLYVVAVSLASIVNLVGSSVAMVALPVVAGLRSVAERTAHARRLISLTLMASTLVAVPMIVFAAQLLEFLFGQAFRDVQGAARVLIVATVLLSTGRTVGAILRAVGRPLQAGLSDMLALLVTIVALSALLPLLGLVGAAVAAVLAYGVSLAWMVDRAARALGVRPVQLFLPDGVLRPGATTATGRPDHQETN